MQKLIPLNNILAKGYLAYTGFKEIIKQNIKIKSKINVKKHYLYLQAFPGSLLNNTFLFHAFFLCHSK